LLSLQRSLRSELRSDGGEVHPYIAWAKVASSSTGDMGHTAGTAFLLVAITVYHSMLFDPVLLIWESDIRNKNSQCREVASIFKSEPGSVASTVDMAKMACILKSTSLAWCGWGFKKSMKEVKKQGVKLPGRLRIFWRLSRRVRRSAQSNQGWRTLLDELTRPQNAKPG